MKVLIGPHAKLISEPEKHMANGSQQSWILQRVDTGPIAMELTISDAVDGANSSSYTLPIVVEKPTVYSKNISSKPDETLYEKDGDKAAKYAPGAYVNFKDGPDRNTLCYVAPPGYVIEGPSVVLAWPEQAAAAMSSEFAKELSNNIRVCYRLSAQSDQYGKGAGVAQIKVIIDSVVYQWDPIK